VSNVQHPAPVVKVRIGYGLGTRTLTNTQDRFLSLVDGLERSGFDSLWLSERIGAPSPDPVVGLAVAAGRSERLRLGMSVMVLPGRNPVLLAKQMASLDQLCNGRLLPAFGLGIRDPHEQQAFAVERGSRARRFDEALPLMRRLWTEDAVSHKGEYFSINELRVRPHPAHELEVWMGGSGPKELERVGRLSDGWLASFVTPQIAAAGWHRINAAAAEAAREMDQGHFGVLVPYGSGEIAPRLAKLLALRAPGVDPRDVVPGSLEELRSALKGFIEVGASKFVLVPLDEPQNWDIELPRVR
jgi:probable F420-dependent oxidoreductase